MKILDTCFAWAMVVLGIVHAAATLSMGPIGLGSVWFFSAGTAVIMAGLLNLIRIRRSGGFERGCAILANLLIVAMLAGATWFLFHRLRQNPQVAIAWGITVVELAFSLRGRR
jgi:L-asparagine transporter-like permease